MQSKVIQICCLFLVLAGTLSFFSCSEGGGEANAADMCTLSFTVKVGKAETLTRGDGDVSLEDKVSTLDLWLYPASAGDDEKAKLHLRYDVSKGNITQSGKVVTLTTTVISKGTINQLFPTSDTWCKVYTVANLPEGTTIASDATITEIENTSVVADFTQEQITNFVMTGLSDGENKGNTVTKSTDMSTGKDQLTGNVDLKRIASKITFGVSKVQDSVTDENGTIWTPDLVGDNNTCTMNLSIYNGVKIAQIGKDDRVLDDNNDYFNISGSDAKSFDIKTTTGDNGTTTTTYPLKETLYSYPSDWGRDTNPTKECYLELMVPWKNSAGKVLNTYYQIPIGEILSNAGEQVRMQKLGRNYHYNISVEVGILGSFTPAEAVKLTASYIVLDWQTEVIIGVKMKEVNYLTVAPSQVEMNNVATGSVSYITSHKLVMDASQQHSTRITEISFYDYSQNTIQKISMNRDVSASGTITRTYSVNGTQQGSFSSDDAFKYTKNDHDVSWSDFTLSDNGNGILTLNGYPVNKLNSQYVPYTVTVNVSNARTGVSDQTVTFVQYPPIYIVGEKSNGYVWVNGYTFKENDTQAYDDSWNYLGTAGTSSGNNTNFNNYAIHISSLSDQTYSIGDTRGVQNNLSNLSKLTSYHPTREDLDDSNLMLSPIYLFASSYGATMPVTYENAKKRCAAYQENGYPAGRWRLPTLGEIKFAVMLSQAGVFPRLFGSSTSSNTAYWYANSEYKYYRSADQDTKTADSSSENYVRCVYDLWYWGDDRQTNWYTNSTWSN